MSEVLFRIGVLCAERSWFSYGYRARELAESWTGLTRERQRSATSAQGTPSRTPVHIGDFLAKGSSQIDLMVLLLNEDLPNLLCHGILPERFTLPDAIAVIPDCLVFIFEIVPEHLSRFF